MILFWRIFLSFWLAAVLLAASFFLLGRYSSSETIDKTLTKLKAQAEVVAALWKNEGGRPAVRHWLFQQSEDERPLLLDETGQPPMRRHRMMHARKPWRYSPISPGVKYEKHGRVTIAAALPGIEPRLFLVRQLGPAQLHNMSRPLMLVISVAVIALVSLLLAYMLVRRIRVLRETVSVITDGDLSARVNISGHDEVSALASDFNLMADRINEMMSSQRQLVSDVSHELRSPLARLRIALELAERSENPQSMLAKIEKEASELEQLVSSLLSLSRMESGQSVLEKQMVMLCPLIQKIIDDANFEGEATQRRVVLETCEDIELLLDPVLIQSAIENVIRNALRYTPEGGKVTVRSINTGNNIEIIIDDEGPGVAKDKLDRLFEPFTRVDEARDRDSGGYGLGLAITGKTMLAHGGKAHAENLPQGGLRVTLILPIND